MSVSNQPLNKLPSGLLRFLGVSGPDAPNRLLDSVQGTIDLFNWWAQAIEYTQNTTVALLGGGYHLAYTVPAGQRWIVTGFNCRQGLSGAGQIVQLTCAHREFVTGNIILVGETGARTVWTAGSLFATATGISIRGEYLVLGPGDDLGAFANETGAGGMVACNVTLRLASFAA